ncbi:MAG: hypothetical protein ACRCXZ_07480, partial [Patescibacteria group bacterium]
MNRSFIASFLLALNFVTGISPVFALNRSELIVGQAFIEPQPISDEAASRLNEMRESMNSQGDAYIELNNFLINEMLDYYNSNKDKVKAEMQSGQPFGEVLDFASMELEEGKKALIFSVGDVEQKLRDFRVLYRLVPPDTESEEYSRQIGKLSEVHRLYVIDFINNKGPINNEAKPQNTNEDVERRVAKFFSNIGMQYDIAIQDNLDVKHWGNQSLESIIFQVDNPHDRLAGVYKLYGLDDFYIEYNVDSQKLRKFDTSDLDETNKAYFRKLVLSSALYLYDTQGIEIRAEYCSEIKQIFNRDCNDPPLGKKDNESTTELQQPSQIEQIQTQNNDPEAVKFISDQLDLLSKDTVFDDLVQRIKNSGFTTLNSKKWLYTVLPYSKVELAGLSEQDYEGLINRL